MSDKQDLLLQIAAFLRMQADGYILVPEHVRKEARELFYKLGNVMFEELQDEANRLKYRLK